MPAILAVLLVTARNKLRAVGSQQPGGFDEAHAHVR